MKIFRGCGYSAHDSAPYGRSHRQSLICNICGLAFALRSLRPGEAIRLYTVFRCRPKCIPRGRRRRHRCRRTKWKRMTSFALDSYFIPTLSGFLVSANKCVHVTEVQTRKKMAIVWHVAYVAKQRRPKHDRKERNILLVNARSMTAFLLGRHTARDSNQRAREPEVERGERETAKKSKLFALRRGYRSRVH